MLENQGGEKFFGEPALDLEDFMRTDRDGRGVINVLAADKLMRNPRLYATFLLWMLSELFEQLPEVGDPEKPKLVFFFDEAHLLFNDAPKALLEKIEQVVRLIRSKGVGVYFVTQNPLDVPDKVLAQLGNRVQHALRAFTPRDQKAVKTAADTFRPNPKLDTGRVITELGKGEALVSFLEGDGTPTMVDRADLPRSTGARGAGDSRGTQGDDRQQSFQRQIRQTLDAELAYEMLQGRTKAAARRPGERRRLRKAAEFWAASAMRSADSSAPRPRAASGCRPTERGARGDRPVVNASRVRWPPISAAHLRQMGHHRPRHRARDARRHDAAAVAPYSAASIFVGL